MIEAEITMSDKEEMSILSQKLLKEYARQTCPKTWLAQFSQSMSYSATATESIKYQSKYAEKLAQKAKEQGTTVDTLFQKTRDAQKPESDPFDLTQTLMKPKPASTLSLKPLAPLTSTSNSTNKNQLYPSLDTIINVKNVEKESLENIGKLWTLYHSTKPQFLCGVVTPAFHSTLFTRGKTNPTFVVPIQREAGAAFFLLQFTPNQVYFTPLEAYKLNKENAMPCLVLTHYTDIVDTVLMRGEVDLGLQMEEAERLVYMLQLFYGDEKKFEIVKRFTKGGPEFDYNDIIAAADVLA